MLRSFYREAAENWCHFAHAEPMWPVNGEYRCRTCLRTYPVPWANTTAPAKANHSLVGQTVLSAHRL
jgi:hypothetical protein